MKDNKEWQEGYRTALEDVAMSKLGERIKSAYPEDLFPDPKEEDKPKNAEAAYIMRRLASLVADKFLEDILEELKG